MSDHFGIVCIKELILLLSYMQHFLAWQDLVGFYAGKICRKPKLKTPDTKLKKNCSVLLIMIVSGLDALILCLKEVLHQFEILRVKSDKMSNIIFPE